VKMKSFPAQLRVPDRYTIAAELGPDRLTGLYDEGSLARASLVPRNEVILVLQAAVTGVTLPGICCTTPCAILPVHDIRDSAA
jgi:hypothetical protein